MSSLIATEISRRVFEREGRRRAEIAHTVGLNDNGWESWPLEGASAVVYNDVPSDLSTQTNGLTMRSIACEFRWLIS